MDNLDEIRAYKAMIIQEILQFKKENLESYSVDEIIQYLACEDTDLIPKVANAGMVFDDHYQLMHNGVKVLLGEYMGNSGIDLIRGFRGHHEPQEEKVFYEVLKFMPPGAVMIELGSYWAYYSLWFATEVPDCKNYLIEPCLKKLKLSVKNFQLNQKSGHFFHGSTGRPVGLGYFQGAVDYTIDEFVSINQIDHVNILHSDIQSCEFSMLHGAIKSIQLGKIDYFFISTHRDIHHRDGHPLCLDFLLKHNFTIVAEHSIEEGYSADGLIVAKRKGTAGPDHVSISKRPKKSELQTK